jgi:hypothetical protein
MLFLNQRRLEIKSNHLKHKKSELDIMSETAKEEFFNREIC